MHRLTGPTVSSESPQPQLPPQMPRRSHRGPTLQVFFSSYRTEEGPAVLRTLPFYLLTCLGCRASPTVSLCSPQAAGRELPGERGSQGKTVDPGRSMPCSQCVDQATGKTLYLGAETFPHAASCPWPQCCQGGFRAVCPTETPDSSAIGGAALVRLLCPASSARGMGILGRSHASALPDGCRKHRGQICLSPGAASCAGRPAGEESQPAGQMG